MQLLQFSVHGNNTYPHDDERRAMQRACKRSGENPERQVSMGDRRPFADAFTGNPADVVDTPAAKSPRSGFNAKKHRMNLRSCGFRGLPKRGNDQAARAHPEFAISLSGYPEAVSIYRFRP
jgi:hypothetical protein